MKKGLIAVLLIAAIVLVACGGSKKPATMSQETYDNGCRALEIMEKYNDTDISKEDATERLNGILKSLNDEHDTLTDTLERSDNTLVSASITQFIGAMGGAGSSSTYDVVDTLRGYLED